MDSLLSFASSHFWAIYFTGVAVGFFILGFNDVDDAEVWAKWSAGIMLWPVIVPLRIIAWSVTAPHLAGQWLRIKLAE